MATTFEICIVPNPNNAALEYAELDSIARAVLSFLGPLLCAVPVNSLPMILLGAAVWQLTALQRDCSCTRRR